MNASKLDMVNSDLTALLDLLGEVWVELVSAEVAEPVAEPVAVLVAEREVEPLVDEDELSAGVRK